MVRLAAAVADLLRSNLPTSFHGVKQDSYTAPVQSPPPPDILHAYIKASKPTYVAIATVCKSLDVITLSINGYDIKPGKIQSGSLSGTFDSLEATPKDAWLMLFGAPGPSPAPFIISNVSFLPVGNDPNGIINPRLIRNLPLTLIATPSPSAPTAPPAPGASPAPPAPTPPVTRLAQCQASAYRMLITGRVPITSQSTDLSRAIIAGSSLKWSQPQGLASIYTAAGVAVGLLYNPNSAEVGVDVFVCPPQGMKDVATIFRSWARDKKGNFQRDPSGNLIPVNGKADILYQVGGVNHDIVGHKTTPAIGTNPFAQQSALDTAIVDLENQLDCIVSQELDKMGLKPIEHQQLDRITSSPWCSGDASDFPVAGYFKHLETVSPDEPVTQPINAIVVQ